MFVEDNNNIYYFSLLHYIVYKRPTHNNFSDTDTPRDRAAPAAE